MSFGIDHLGCHYGQAGFPGTRVGMPSFVEIRRDGWAGLQPAPVFLPAAVVRQCAMAEPDYWFDELVGALIRHGVGSDVGGTIKRLRLERQAGGACVRFVVDEAGQERFECDRALVMPER